jgi:hypothetical protein
MDLDEKPFSFTYLGEKRFELQRRRDISNVIALGVPGEGKAGADRRVNEQDTRDLGPRVGMVPQAWDGSILIVWLYDEFQRACISNCVSTAY